MPKRNHSEIDLPAQLCTLPAMLRMAVLLLSLSGLMVSCSPLDSASTDRLLVDQGARRYGPIIRHNDTRTIPIVRGEGIAELFVQVQIGTTRGWWQIDTGAALCLVTSSIAHHEGFAPLSAGEILTAAGAVDSQLGTLPSVLLGGLEIKDVTSLFLDEDFVNDFTVHGRRGHVIGILGADLLDHLGATIDLRANLLRLRVP
jgi:hypothetical protein